MSAKRILRSLVGLNAAFTLGGLIGGFVGCASLTSPPTKDRYEGFDPFRLISGLFKLFENLFQLVMFVTAGALIAALVRSLYFILFRLR